MVRLPSNLPLEAEPAFVSPCDQADFPLWTFTLQNSMRWQLATVRSQTSDLPRAQAKKPKKNYCRRREEWDFSGNLVKIPMQDSESADGLDRAKPTTLTVSAVFL